MQELPVALRWYLRCLNLACLALVGGLTVVFLVRQGWNGEPHDVFKAAVLFTVIAFTGHYMVLQVNRSVTQDLATPVHVGAILLLPSPLPVLLTFVSSLASEALRPGSPVYRRAFNVSHPTVVVGLTMGLSSLAVRPTHLLQPGRMASAMPALALLLVLFYVLDVSLMIGVLAFLRRCSPWQIWWQSYRPAFLPELAGSSIGVIAVIMWRFDPLALAFAAFPVVAVRVAFNAISQAEEQSEALRKRSGQLEAVLTAGQRLRLQHTQADLLQPLAEAACTISGAEAVTGYLHDEEDPTMLKRVVVVPPEAACSGPADLPVYQAGTQMQETMLGDVGMVVPILLESDGAGVDGVLLLSGEAPELGHDECDALTILATQGAIALQNARMHERALAQASEDGLTGLLNHRAFQTRLEEEVARAHRGAHPLTLLMADMDDFGTINNAYGHQVGDATLSAVATAIRRTVRAQDVAARYGGDEFVVILPETSMEDALGLAERLRGAIESLVVVDGALTICVHASIGVAALPLHALSREELIRAADQAAYAAKHAGKGRVGRPEDAAFTLDRDPASLAAQLEHANLATVAALAAAVDAKDTYTRGHSQRVSAYAGVLARLMQRTPDDIARVELAGLLHDVGKIGVPDAILAKPSKLSPQEFVVIRQHTLTGERMLASVPFLHDILPAVRHHHERWDGTGYPDGLRGEDIPLDATILMVADSLDAMTSSRTYRPALPLEEARRRILEGRGTQFHPKVVAAFEQALKAGRLTLLSGQAMVQSSAYPVVWRTGGAPAVDGKDGELPARDLQLSA